MSGINRASVVKGGVVAGLVINISQMLLDVPIAGAQMEAELAARNVPSVGGAAIGVFVAMAFLLGILTVWLYAAVRPRLGPGPRTAVVVGLFIWVVIHIWGGVSMATMGLFSWNLALLGIGWGLFESVLAAVAGAYVYRE